MTMNKKVQLSQCPVELHYTLQPRHHLSKFSPIPDMCGSGPVVGYPENKHPNARSVGLVARKRYDAPALHPVGPCCAPCAGGVATQMAPLSHKSDDVRRRCHRGNLLQSFSCDEQHYLLQAVNTDAGSTLKQFTLHGQHDRHLPRVTPVITFKKDSSVYDMQCISINNEMFVLTRSLYTVDVHRIGDECLDYVNKALKEEEMLTSADLNSEEPGFWLQSNQKQKIQLYDSHRKRAVWTCKLPDIASLRGPRWCTSLFAYRSYTGLAANRTSVYTADFRASRFQSLFHTLGEDCKKFSDVICGLTKLSDCPYFLCVLHDQLLLLDERSCRLPVLSWNHMLTDTPQRAVVLGDEPRHVIALSNSTEKKVGLVVVTNCSTEVETYECHVTASLIKHHHLFNPMQSFAHQNNLWFDDGVTKRLCQDVTGLACHKFRGCNDLNIYVSNVCGDVFCQSFQLNDEPLANPAIDIEKEIVEHMKAWEESVDDLAVLKNFATVDVFDVTHSLEKSLSQKKSSVNCAKRTIKEDLWNVSELVEQCRQERIHQEAIVDDRKLNWANILVDDYEIDYKHISKRAPAHVVSHCQRTEQFFSTAMHKRMKDENLEASRDLLAETILGHWPLNKPAENADVTEIGGQTAISVDTYRAVPYSSLLGKGGVPGKYRRLHCASSSHRKTTGSRGSTAPSVGSDDGSMATSGGQSARSDTTTRANLRRLLAATTPINLNAIPPSVMSVTASMRAASPRFSNHTAGSICSSIKKKTKRKAGF